MVSLAPINPTSIGARFRFDGTKPLLPPRNKGRWEYLRAIYERYRKAGRKPKKVILDEFCQNTGNHRQNTNVKLMTGTNDARDRPRLVPS